MKKLNYWIGTQITTYKKKIGVMKYKEVRKTWEDFINDPKYSKYFTKPSKNQSVLNRKQNQQITKIQQIKKDPRNRIIKN